MNKLNNRITFALIAPPYEYANDNCRDEESKQGEEMGAARKNPEISGGELYVAKRDWIGCTEKTLRLALGRLLIRRRRSRIACKKLG